MGKYRTHVKRLCVEVDRSNQSEMVSSDVEHIVITSLIHRIEHPLQIGVPLEGISLDQLAPGLQWLAGRSMPKRELAQGFIANQAHL